MAPSAQKEVPKIRDLCESLGFRTSSDRPQHQLTDSTHVWRRKWRTEGNVAGKDLKTWKAPEVQAQLLRMTLAYLEGGGHGPKLWPTRGSSSPALAPEYTKDKDR